MYHQSVDRSAELRLPTLTVPVRLALVGQEPDNAHLFVAAIARRGRSHLLDDIAAMLDANARFVPVRMDGGVRLLAKRAIAWIAVRRHDDDDPPDTTEEDLSELYDRQHRVAIELVQAAPITGLLLDSSPADRPRVIDHLNRAGAFVRVWSADEQLLVNKDQIIAVTELAATELA